MSTIRGLIAGVAAAAGAMVSAPASAFDLSDCGGLTACPYVTYGDGNSYSLPVNALLWDSVNGGGTGPGNPFYVNSTPGQIKDLTVIGTGADGQPVNTNVGDVDDAYPTPSGVAGADFFSTGTTTDPVVDFTGDISTTWDARLSDVKTFMGTDDSLIFFFNNNQTNSGDTEDQNLAIWAVITLRDDAGVLDPLNLYFTNDGGAYALVSEGGGGDLNGTAGTGTLGEPEGPVAGDNTSTDYVLSGGQLCFNASGLVSCSDPTAIGGPINHNLGADQAVYAVVFPTLDGILALAGFGGYDVMQIDLRMGCDPATTADCEGSAGNHGRSLNNGYEQLFLSTASNVVNVPLPSTALLLAIGLLGAGGLAGRRAARR